MLLTSRERDSLEKKLRQLTAERDQIGDLMTFALDHADKVQFECCRVFLNVLFSKLLQAHDVAQTIAESLTIDTTPLPTKLARLYLVSDILYNTRFFFCLYKRNLYF